MLPTESVAATTTFEVTLVLPVLTGVPEIMPVVFPRLRPLGKVDPLAAAQDQVYPVPLPPLAVNAAEVYAVPG
jgi:hypothetical protein